MLEMLEAIKMYSSSSIFDNLLTTLLSQPSSTVLEQDQFIRLTSLYKNTGNLNSVSQGALRVSGNIQSDSGVKTIESGQFKVTIAKQTNARVTLE